MPQPLRTGLVIGVVVGLALAGAVLGVGATHIVCSAGPVLGQSGTLVTPLDVALAPPGGYVNASWLLKTVFSQNESVSILEWSTFPENSTRTDIFAYNWTLRGENSSTAPGWGSDSPCDGRTLIESGALANGSSGCGGCPIAPAVPAGVGQRTIVPEQFYYNGVPSVLINASYGEAPIASFSWNDTAGALTWSNPGGFDGLPVSLAPFYEFGVLYGLGITLSLSGIGFDVPIQLTNGQSITVPTSFPAAFNTQETSTTTMSITMTYILPLSTDQGSWNAYLPGDGGPFSLGGLLFEQTAAV